MSSLTEPLPSDTILYDNWVLHNFRGFALDKIVEEEGVDPCKSITPSQFKERKYQSFLKKYLGYDTPYRSMLIYHGLGSGKTCTAITIYNALYNSNPNWNVYILLKAALIPIWESEVKKCVEKDSKIKDRVSRINFIVYNRPNAADKFKEIKTKTTKVGANSLYIIDEVHQFISNVYSNMTKLKGRRALEMYDILRNEVATKRKTRILALSATPIMNKPFEIGILFNLLRPNIFPDNEKEFLSVFIDSTSNPVLSNKTKNLFQRRIRGLVSYYIGSTPNLYATSTINHVSLIMPTHMEKVYHYFEVIEAEMEKRKQMARESRYGSSQSVDMFRAYTIQACNFVFPAINNEITGEDRPRPGMFRGKELETAAKIVRYDAFGFEKKKIGDQPDFKLKKDEFKSYENSRKKFVRELTSFWKAMKDASFADDLNLFMTTYKGNPQEFMDQHRKRSKLLESMYQCSPKMVMISLHCMSSKGKVMVYSTYVRMEGLEILCVYLEMFNFSRYGSSEKGATFVELHRGNGTKEHNLALKDKYNDSSNKYGEKIKVALISPSSSEGISFTNVLQVHVLEPYWHEVRIEQVIGRAIRQCSHSDLPKKERHVEIYRYVMKRSSQIITTDQDTYELAMRKKRLSESFLEAVKEVSIDCQLFRNHNQMVTNYPCFRFSPSDILSGESYVGYRNDIYDDNLKESRGSNSINYKIVKSEVFEIKAVFKDPKTNSLQSKEELYWFDIKTGFVYDKITDRLVGRVLKDSDGVFEMKSRYCYVISVRVPIDRYVEYNFNKK